MEQTKKPSDSGAGIGCGDKRAEETFSGFGSDNSNIHDKEGSGSSVLGTDDFVFQDSEGKSRIITPSDAYQINEAKLAALLRKNGTLEGQLASALLDRESAEKNLSSALKGRNEMEKRLGDAMKEIELLKEKLASVESAHEEANSLSNIVHTDNLRLEHDVAYSRAVLDDTQKVLSLAPSKIILHVYKLPL